jgi:hypothetical protein
LAASLRSAVPRFETYSAPSTRADMRRIAAEIGPADAERLAVGIEPISTGSRLRPSAARGCCRRSRRCRRPCRDRSRRACCRVIGAVGGGLQAARDRLAIVVAERAGDARRQAGGFRREQQCETASA